MTQGLLAGAVLGLGVWLVLRSVRPARPSLADALAALRPMPLARPIVIPAEDGCGPIARLGAPLARSFGARAHTTNLLMLPSVPGDLSVMGRSMERHLAEKLATAAIGLILPTVVTGLLTLAGAVPPLALPLLLAIALAGAGFVAPDLSLHSEAEKRREEFREALSVFVDLTSLGLASGSGVEEALAMAARVGDGWAFGQLRRALEVTLFTRETSWAALARLGQELGVAELEEAASSIGLAESRGAPVRESLAERARAMRTARLAEAEANARRASQRMSLPVVLLLVGFIVFLAYPAVDRIVGVGS